MRATGEREWLVVTLAKTVLFAIIFPQTILTEIFFLPRIHRATAKTFSVPNTLNTNWYMLHRVSKMPNEISQYFIKNHLWQWLKQGVLQYAIVALSEHQSDTSASQMQTGAQTGFAPGLVRFHFPYWPQTGWECIQLILCILQTWKPCALGISEENYEAM